jgi:hypothetical protein
MLLEWKANRKSQKERARDKREREKKTGAAGAQLGPERGRGPARDQVRRMPSALYAQGILFGSQCRSVSEAVATLDFHDWV